MIGMSSSNFLFKTFLSTSNTTFELLLHFFYIGGNMLPASILSFVFSSKNELYMVWAGRRDPWWGWLRGWEHAIWLGCYYLFRKQRKCLLTQLQIAPLPSLASLTVRIFSWGTKLKRDWERSNPSHTHPNTKNALNRPSVLTPHHSAVQQVKSLVKEPTDIKVKFALWMEICILLGKCEGYCNLSL